jgi:hypothetical protein
MSATEYESLADKIAKRHAALEPEQDTLTLEDEALVDYLDAFATADLTTDKHRSIRKAFTMRQFTLRSDTVLCYYLRGLSATFPVWLGQYIEDGTLPTMQQLRDDEVVHIKSSKSRATSGIPDAYCMQWEQIVESGNLKEGIESLTTAMGITLPVFLQKLYANKPRTQATDSIADFKGANYQPAIQSYCEALATTMLALDQAEANPRHILWPPGTLEKGAAEIADLAKELGVWDIEDL